VFCVVRKRLFIMT